MSIGGAVRNMLRGGKLLRIILPVLITLTLYQLAFAFYVPKGPADPFAPVHSFMAQRRAGGYVPFDHFVYLPLVIKNW
jgi:hypothetical protein